MTFKHILTQDVAYHSLSPARQRGLHERTAQAIEGLFGERLAEHYGELAYHYSRSEQHRSRPWYISSGRDNRRPTGRPIGKRSASDPGVGDAAAPPDARSVAARA